MKALGMIETRGLVTAIESLDVALKTANIEVVNRHIVRGGIVTVEITGDVGAVKVATEAGAEAAKRLGNFISCHVIPRPDDSVYEMIEETIKVEDTQRVEFEKNIIEEKIEENKIAEKQEINFVNTEKKLQGKKKEEK